MALPDPSFASESILLRQLSEIGEKDAACASHARDLLGNLQCTCRITPSMHDHIRPGTSERLGSGGTNSARRACDNDGSP
jgi:hypothetical protein